MNIPAVNDIAVYEKIDSGVCRLLPEPFDKYAFNFKKWVEYAQKEHPPGKCVFICSAIKSMVSQKSDYIEAALEIVETESDAARASILGLAGLVLSFIGQNNKGIQHLRDSSKLEPCNRAFLSLAAELGEIDCYDESCEICQRILLNDPDNSEAKRILAINCLNMGEIEKARKLISEVMVKNSKDKKARRTLGKILFIEKKYKSAILEFKKTVGFFDYNPCVIYHLALCYFAMGQIKKSRWYVKRINPKVFKITPYFRDNEIEIKEDISEILGEK